MKILHKLVRSLLAVCMAAQLLAVPALAAGEQEIYLALGDSISAGYGLSNRQTESFVTLVGEELSDYTVVNKAVDGNTASDIYQQLTDPSNANYVSEDTLKNASLITITCGGNDVMDAVYSVMIQEFNEINNTNLTRDDLVAIINREHPTLDVYDIVKSLKFVNETTIDSADCQQALRDFEENLSTVISYIRQKNPNAAVLITTQYNPYKVFEPKAVYRRLYQAIVPALVTETNREVCSHIHAQYKCGCGGNCADAAKCATPQSFYSYDHLKYHCGCGKCSDPKSCPDRTLDFSHCPQPTPRKTLNGIISDNASSLGYLVSDVCSAFSASEAEGTKVCNAYYIKLNDAGVDFHPNATGHTVIADTVLDTVRATIDAISPAPAIVSADLSRGTVTFKGSSLYSYAAVAFYDANERMVGFKMQTMTGTETETTMTTSLRASAVKAKVFFLKRATLIPDGEVLIFPK